ncbi:CAMPATH-1 antigen [Mesocricetus auratus]|uniref:CAMPATH-1 antigen n=1 Tax=Mesocricetus auratus TaxID=10036 RepID=A0A1U7R2H6_MESAU|nr:CAMPATH-1 antigen [Mesocricetus auratus]
MNSFLLLVTISLLVAVQIQTGVLGNNATKVTTPARPATTVKHASPRSGASSLIDAGACSFFFFANFLMCFFSLS